MVCDSIGLKTNNGKKYVLVVKKKKRDLIGAIFYLKIECCVRVVFKVNINRGILSILKKECEENANERRREKEKRKEI